MKQAIHFISLFFRRILSIVVIGFGLLCMAYMLYLVLSDDLECDPPRSMMELEECENRKYDPPHPGGW